MSVFQYGMAPTAQQGHDLIKIGIENTFWPSWVGDYKTL